MTPWLADHDLIYWANWPGTEVSLLGEEVYIHILYSVEWASIPCPGGATIHAVEDGQPRVGRV